MAPLLVDILVYRAWARELAERVKSTYKAQHDIYIHSPNSGYHEKADLTFLIGWSNIVPIEFYKDRTVLVLHPSPLPKYRGGSPIQHQILAGETKSSVTLFKLDKDYPEVDSGPIYLQYPFYLYGSLEDILSRIVDAGQLLVESAISNFSRSGSLPYITQEEREATTFKRRKPEESEITLKDLEYNTAFAIYNKIRALQDPYPNAFITMADGSKLYLTGTHL